MDKEEYYRKADLYRLTFPSFIIRVDEFVDNLVAMKKRGFILEATRDTGDGLMVAYYINPNFKSFPLKIELDKGSEV